jgi:hypothetical protein
MGDLNQIKAQVNFGQERLFSEIFRWKLRFYSKHNHYHLHFSICVSDTGRGKELGAEPSHVSFPSLSEVGTECSSQTPGLKSHWT